jgi:hypothetical protein
VAAIDGNVSAALEEALEIVFRRRVDDDRDIPGATDGGELIEADHPVSHGMMRHDEERRRAARADGFVEMVGLGDADRANRNDFPARQPDRLFNGGAIAHHVTLLDQHLVAQAGRLRQAFDSQQALAGHGACYCHGNAAGAARRDESRFGARQAGDDAARLPLELVHLDELGRDGGHGGDRFRHHDRGAECRHRSGDVDDRPQAKLLADVAATRGLLR